MEYDLFTNIQEQPRLLTKWDNKSKVLGKQVWATIAMFLEFKIMNLELYSPSLGIVHPGL